MASGVRRRWREGCRESVGRRIARFLVQISISLPAQMPDAERETILEAERECGRALKTAGLICDIWRIPGRLANVGIWEARNATQLHGALTSLPLWPFASVSVTPLVDHYLTRDTEEPRARAE